MPVFSVATQKGGAAKTTTALNLGAALQRLGKSVLLIDSDPQANLTYSLGESDDREQNLYTEYKKETSGQKSQLAQTIIKTRSGLSLIPSSLELANTEMELASKLAREHTFKNRMLKPIVNDYDYIIIDCPPSFGMLTINALIASDYVIIPLQGEFLPKKGVESFLKLIHSMKEMLNAKIEIAGFLLTRFSELKKMNLEIRAWLHENFPDKLFNTFIHTDIKLAMAQRKGLDIFTYAGHSVAAADYEHLALEFLEHERALLMPAKKEQILGQAIPSPV